MSRDVRPSNSNSRSRNSNSNSNSNSAPPARPARRSDLDTRAAHSSSRASTSHAHARNVNAVASASASSIRLAHFSSAAPLHQSLGPCSPASSLRTKTTLHPAPSSSSSSSTSDSSQAGPAGSGSGSGSRSGPALEREMDEMGAKGQKKDAQRSSREAEEQRGNVVQSAKADVHTHARMPSKSTSGTGAVVGYGKRRSASPPTPQAGRAHGEVHDADADADSKIVRSYRHEYAPTSRTTRPLPIHTYSSPSSSFNASAAGIANAPSARSAEAHGSLSRIHGLGGSAAGSGAGSGSASNAQEQTQMQSSVAQAHQGDGAATTTTTTATTGSSGMRRKKTALIFPGQGSQYVTMANDVYRRFRSARHVWHEAEESLSSLASPSSSSRSSSSSSSKRSSKSVPGQDGAQREAFEEVLRGTWQGTEGVQRLMPGLGADVRKRGWLRDMVFSGDQLTLTLPYNSLPSILVCSLSILSVLRQDFSRDLILDHASLAAGHGAGVYAALVGSSSLALDDAVRLTRFQGVREHLNTLEHTTLFPEGCKRPESVFETWAFANSGSGKGQETILAQSGEADIDVVKSESAAQVRRKTDSPSDGDHSPCSSATMETDTQGRRIVKGWKRSQMSGVMVRPGKLLAAMQVVRDTQKDISAGRVEDVAQDEVVEIANINNNLQLVLSGTRVGVSLASDRIRQQSLGARAVNLPVGGPYHSSLMNRASDDLREAIRCLPLMRSEGYGIVSSVSQGASLLREAEDIRADLMGYSSKVVRWLESIDKLVEQGVQRFVCLGPGRACAHLLSKELAHKDRLRMSQGLQPAEYEVWSITSVEDIEQLGTLLSLLSDQDAPQRSDARVDVASP
ncbi:malonyl-acyl carrier protein transacylase [Ceraceosorus bombacis]|uniref:[acyl-carrier-protein] S-malonyltransferase n=1 Tax=Ceraceosorus bombacis TaxID=401625 RepID=A0A0P1BC96_9BASI|nr:malonyl-acyl carrier protein transacylase [Ceraceosorus bombacis]